MRGLLLGCCAATATAAVLAAGPLPASGAALGAGPQAASGAVLGSGRLPVSGDVLGSARTGAAAADTTPPSEPGAPSPRNVYLNGVAGLTWQPSTDDVGVTGYQVYAWAYGTPANVPFTRANARITTASSTTPVYAEVSDLIPGRDYLFYVVAVDAAGNRSVPSLLTKATAMVEPPTPGPSPAPAIPHAPTNLRIGSGLGTGNVTLTWSTEDAGGSVVFIAFRRSSSEWSYSIDSVIPRTLASIGAEPSYTFQVIARNTAGTLLSPPSDPATYTAPSPTPSATPTATPTPSVACAVTYDATTWATGFLAVVNVKNTGSTPIDGWRLAFDFPLTTQRLTSGWSAVWAQSGTTVSATDQSWSKIIKPGQVLWLGFNGVYSGSNPSPTAFTLNGATCASG
ncbi:cellulose binding domain-containing protein [Sphaerisporangium sp. NPDC004334]